MVTLWHVIKSVNNIFGKVITDFFKITDIGHLNDEVWTQCQDILSQVLMAYIYY